MKSPSTLFSVAILASSFNSVAAHWFDKSCPTDAWEGLWEAIDPVDAGTVKLSIECFNDNVGRKLYLSGSHGECLQFEKSDIFASHLIVNITQLIISFKHIDMQQGVSVPPTVLYASAIHLCKQGSAIILSWSNMYQLRTTPWTTRFH